MSKSKLRQSCSPEVPPLSARHPARIALPAFVAFSGVGARCFVSLCALMVGIAVAGEAVAQLSEIDLVPGSGDAKITLDAATGLYWLDLTETTNTSVPEILGGAGGWLTAGWRYATATEICDLFETYALAIPNCPGLSGAQTTGNIVGNLQSFVGLTVDDPLSPFSGGFFDDLGLPDRVGIGRLLYQSAIDTSSLLVQSNATFAAASPTFGNWLVREDPPGAAVPTLPWPQAVVLALLLIALAAVLARARMPRVGASTGSA